MAESKEPAAYFNSAYYGPTVPPQQTHRNDRRGMFHGCSPYKLICTLLKIFTTTLIVLGIIVLVLWLIFQPADLKVYVEKASLTQFNLTTNHTLYHNLTIEMSFRNPNQKLGIHYERVEATALYDGSRFGYVALPAFHQPHKNTTLLHPSFQGQALVLGDSVTTTFDREKGEGFFYINIKVYTRVKLKMVVVNSIAYTPEVDCTLRLPVVSNGSSTEFTRTKCDVGTFA